MDYEAFKVWLARGAERAPHLYGGGIVHKMASDATAGNVVRQEAARIEPARDGKAAASGEEWDGYQEEEPE